MTDLECVRRRDEPTIARALIHAEATNDGRARIVRENLIPRPEANHVQAAPHGSGRPPHSVSALEGIPRLPGALDDRTLGRIVDRLEHERGGRSPTAAATIFRTRSPVATTRTYRSTCRRSAISSICSTSATSRSLRIGRRRTGYYPSGGGPVQ